MSGWKRELTELELRALCDFIGNPKNECEKIAQKDYPSYKGEGLKQILYKYPRTEECVLVIKQKGYIVNALHIKPQEMEDFLKKWDNSELFPYGNRQHMMKDEKTKGENEVADDEEHSISGWKRKLTEVELRALCDFMENPKNECEKIAQKDYPGINGRRCFKNDSI